VLKFTFTVTMSRFGLDHVTVERDILLDLVTIHRDARDLESGWELSRAKWPEFLEAIGQRGAPDPVTGAQLAVEAGDGARVLKAASDIATLVFSEIDWDVAHGD
jgi:hypothetical protein